MEKLYSLTVKPQGLADVRGVPQLLWVLPLTVA